MTEVYSQAKKVFGWLGPENDGTLAFKNIRTATWSTAGLVFAERHFLDRVEAQQEPDSRTWRAAGRLFRRPRFHCMWLIQELLLAKSVGLVWGPQNTKLWAFADLTLALQISRPKPVLWSTDDPEEDEAIECFVFLMSLRKHSSVVDGLSSDIYTDTILRFARSINSEASGLWSSTSADPSKRDPENFGDATTTPHKLE
jgi:hypothetical protein